jgi:hypothetical protein
MIQREMADELGTHDTSSGLVTSLNRPDRRMLPHELLLHVGLFSRVEALVK